MTSVVFCYPRCGHLNPSSSPGLDDLVTILRQQERLSTLLTDVSSHFHPQINDYVWFEVSVIYFIKLLSFVHSTSHRSPALTPTHGVQEKR